MKPFKLNLSIIAFTFLSIIISNDAKCQLFIDNPLYQFKEKIKKHPHLHLDTIYQSNIEHPDIFIYSYTNNKDGNSIGYCFDSKTSICNSVIFTYPKSTFSLVSVENKLKEYFAKKDELTWVNYKDNLRARILVDSKYITVSIKSIPQKIK